MSKIVILDGNSLTIEELFNISFNNYKIELSKDKKFINRLLKSRNILEKFIDKGYPVYGVTTGFGDSCHNQINAAKTERLQESLVNFHGIGVGEVFSEAESRAVILARLNSNIKGYSAIRIEVADLMKELLNRDISPVIPELGSVGASGDLTPLSYLAAVLMGKRRVYYKNKITGTGTAFKKEKLTPLKLQAKEGLALMNGTSVMTAVAALCWSHAEKLSHISDFISGVTVEILGGNDIPYRRKVSEIKNHNGQIESAGYIKQVIKDSGRVIKYEYLLNDLGTLKGDNFRKTDVKIQDRYSLRCSPQINGVMRDTLAFTKCWIENELNSANDNPLIDPDEGIIYNSGNFYGGHICAACDYLRTSIANIADLSEKQAELIIDGKYNNLTENLIPKIPEDSEDKGLFHGFKAAQISISALCSEINYMASPVSIHSRPTESHNQDKVSLGTISSRKLREVLELLYYQYSIHLLAVCQAMDLIGTGEFGTFARKVYGEIRKISRFVKEDRPLDEDVNAVKTFLKKTDLFNF
ncbi:MAG: aromatic amino acid ammonia-lyase [Spirochaetota bacterium]